MTTQMSTQDRTPKRVKMEHSAERFSGVGAEVDQVAQSGNGLMWTPDAQPFSYVHPNAAAAAASSSQMDKVAASSLAAAAASSSMSVPQSSSAMRQSSMMTESAPTNGNATREERANDVDQLQDLLGMSGVDLRAEEEAIHGRLTSTQSSSLAGSAASMGASYGRPRTPFYLELYPLSHRIHKIAARNGLDVDPEVLMFISRAAQMRFRNLVTSMVHASRHRQWSSHLRSPPVFHSNARPMYHEDIHDDPQKLLNALAKAEKSEEQAARQARMEREEMEARQANGHGDEGGGGGAGTLNASSSNADGALPNVSARSAVGSGTGFADGDGAEDGKRKGKKQGASAAARNMTEDKRLRLANNTAARALGISAGSKAWMFGAGSLPGDSSAQSKGRSGAASRLPKPRFAQANPDDNDGHAGAGSTERGNGAGVGSENGTESISNVGGWGDLAARQRRKEEEERLRKRRVNLDDALHALEMERKGGAGRGSGERVLFATRALGRPTIPVLPPSSLPSTGNE